MIAIDQIPDSAGESFEATELGMDDVSHLQYTSGSTRPPVGVEITHRAVGTNLVQMILSIDLLDRNTHGVSWLPLYHDMGLSMIGFPAVYGGHSTLMSPAAFVRRPLRWIQALSGRLAAGQRRHRRAELRLRVGGTARPAHRRRGHRSAQRGDDHRLRTGQHRRDQDLQQGVRAIRVAPHCVQTVLRHRRGTLLVATIAPTAEATAVYFDREQLGAGHAVRVPADAPNAVAQVSCGQVARSEWAVIVDPGNAAELPEGQVGEIWLQGNNIGRGYWGLPEATRLAFGAELRSRLTDGSHAHGADLQRSWLRTGDLGVYLDGELYVTGRMADLITIEGRNHYPHDIEATVAEASPMIRRGYVTAFSVPAENNPGTDRLVVVAERAAGTSRQDPQPAIEAIHEAVSRRHGLTVSDVRLLPAGAIPRTTSGKLARRACRAEYLGCGLSAH